MFIFEESLLKLILYSHFMQFILKQQKCACEMFKNVESAT